MPPSTPLNPNPSTPGPPWARLLRGQAEAVCLDGPGAGVAEKRPDLLLPGAFNPLHAGHLQIAQTASEVTGRFVAFEISIENVDKPPLEEAEIAARAAQFSPRQTLWLTRSATFAEKSRLFPGAIFAVGIDTLLRIADPRYYEGDSAACRRSIEQIAQRDCRFLVFGRLMPGGFQTLDDLSLPPALQQICSQVSPRQFRNDLSSTELRGRGEKD